MEDDAPETRVFLSYANEHRAKVGEVAAQLQGMGYQVFFDQSSLEQTRHLSDSIRYAIEECSLFVFFVSPESTQPGRFPLTELGYIEKRFPNPVGHVFPVQVAPGGDLRVIPYIGRNIPVFVANGDFTEEVCARIKALVASQEDTSRSSVGDDVDALIDALSAQRKSREGSPEQAKHKRTVDALVARIKRGFYPVDGTVVAGARLLRVIGNGNFGTVWEAQQEDATTVAVKVFHLHRLAEGHMVSRFRRSIRAMRILTEAKRMERREDQRGHIVPIYKVDPSRLAFSMKLLSGGDLEDLERFSWNLEKKLRVMLSVCAAVAYSHRHGVIHRDIKPANVVMDEVGQPVLTDFDIADIKFATRLSTTIEKSLGTPVFAAPEQLEDAAQVTEQADIYSLGRLLYFFLLERSPGYQIEKDPSLDNLSKFPPALVEIVRKATRLAPTKRFQNVDQMVRALEACQTGAAAWRARTARGCRWARRNWAVLGVTGLLVSGSTAAAIYQRRVASQELRLRQLAEDAKTLETRYRVQADQTSTEVNDLSLQLTKSIEDKDTAVERLEVAQTELKGLEARYRVSPSPALREEVKEAKHKVESATAALKRLKKQQSDLATELRRLKARIAAQRRESDGVLSAPPEDDPPEKL